jgi:hypothetical protein
VTKLWEVLRVHWRELLLGAIIGAIVSLIIGPTIAAIWGEISVGYNTWIANNKNMTHDEALAEANETIGASTVDVIPFRNAADSDQQYIAVITDPPGAKTLPKNPYPEGSQEAREFFLSEETWCAWESPVVIQPCYSIKVLLKTDVTSPEVIDPGLAAFDYATASHKYVEGKFVEDRTSEAAYRKRLLGVVDIDEDGNKEVYSMYRSLSGVGTGTYLVKIWLYDSLTQEVYELKGMEEITSTTINPHFTGKRPIDEFATWMREKADTLNLFNHRNDPYSQEVREWIRNNGAGFDEGQPKIVEHRGQIPESGGSTACYVDDGEFEWRSYFKGALFGYDKSRGVHYIVWVPESNYDWVREIVAGKRYLWFDIIKDEGLLVFDKEAQALAVIPAPELKETAPNRPQPIGPQNYAHAFRLMVNGSSLYVQDFDASKPGGAGAITSLSLPNTINVEEEFESAAKCSPDS